MQPVYNITIAVSCHPIIISNVSTHQITIFNTLWQTAPHLTNEALHPRVNTDLIHLAQYYLNPLLIIENIVDVDAYDNGTEPQ